MSLLPLSCVVARISCWLYFVCDCRGLDNLSFQQLRLVLITRFELSGCTIACDLVLTQPDHLLKRRTSHRLIDFSVPDVSLQYKPASSQRRLSTISRPYQLCTRARLTRHYKRTASPSRPQAPSDSLTSQSNTLIPTEPSYEELYHHAPGPPRHTHRLDLGTSDVPPLFAGPGRQHRCRPCSDAAP